MKYLESFKQLNTFERILWAVSLVVVTASFLLAPQKDYLSLAASLIGVTALIFVAKGLVLGQMLTVIFSVFYGIISVVFGYYGEAITYLLMTTPMAMAAIISWIRHPFKDSDEVEVAKLNKSTKIILAALTVVVTVAFYFILGALGNKNLIVSTLSVTTSFVAASLTYLRSPYYAIGYSLNDIVLIALWLMAAISQPKYIPMIFCFVMFLANDLYGFVYWRRMEKRQKEN